MTEPVSEHKPGPRACRHCGACCIAPSISSLQKIAGQRCPHLSDANLCQLFNSRARPDVCISYAPGPDCGETFAEAMSLLERYEMLTRP